MLFSSACPSGDSAPLGITWPVGAGYAGDGKMRAFDRMFLLRVALALPVAGLIGGVASSFYDGRHDREHKAELRCQRLDAAWLLQPQQRLLCQRLRRPYNHPLPSNWYSTSAAGGGSSGDDPPPGRGGTSGNTSGGTSGTSGQSSGTSGNRAAAPVETPAAGPVARRAAARAGTPAAARAALAARAAAPVETPAAAPVETPAAGPVARRAAARAGTPAAARAALAARAAAGRRGRHEREHQRRHERH